jgi:small subunit ribosomal protein S20
MANIRSAEKQRRQAEKARVRNRAGKSRLKSALKEARTGAANLGKAFSEIDKAAKKGLIKNNTANRYKSRLSAAAKRAEAK